VYRSNEISRQRLDARVGAEALMVSWPAPVVVFAGATFEQRQRFQLSSRATLIAIDCLISGRHACGERWAFDEYMSRWEIERDGRPIFLDQIRLAAADGGLQGRMRPFEAYAVVVLTGPLVREVGRDMLADTKTRPVAAAADPIVSAAPLPHDPC